MEKRGSISIEMIILIILALITLVVVAVAFTGGMSQLVAKISGISSAIPSSSFGESTCKSFCDSNSSSYCTYQFTGDLAGKKCRELYPSCPQANVGC